MTYYYDTDPLNLIIPITDEQASALVDVNGNSQCGYTSENGGSKEYRRAAGRHATFNTWTAGGFTCVKCEEHNRWELVPDASYTYGELRMWYKAAGLHPRFANLPELLMDKCGWQMWWLNRVIGWGNSPDNPNQHYEAVKKALIECNGDPDKFVELVKAANLVPKRHRITANGRRVDVDGDFAKRYKAKDFTVQDFLREFNQERRRLIIHSRAFTMEDVVKRMHVLAKDDEAEIVCVRGDETGQHYLHVECPTTHEHYLLGIPTRTDAEFNRWGGLVHAFTKVTWTPAEARRWTFGLDADAQILVEA